MLIIKYCYYEGVSVLSHHIVLFLGIFVEKPLMYFIAIAFPTSSPPLVLEKNVEHLTERQGTFFMLILGEFELT